MSDHCSSHHKYDPDCIECLDAMAAQEESSLASVSGSAKLWGVWNDVFEEWLADDNRKDWTGTREQAVKLEEKMRADGARGIEVKEYPVSPNDKLTDRKLT